MFFFSLDMGFYSLQIIICLLLCWILHYSCVTSYFWTIYCDDFRFNIKLFQVPLLTSGPCIVMALQRDNAVLAFDSIMGRWVIVKIIDIDKKKMKYYIFFFIFKWINFKTVKNMLQVWRKDLIMATNSVEYENLLFP